MSLNESSRKSVSLLDESTDDFQQNFKLIKENKLKLANISRYLVPKTTNTVEEKPAPVEKKKAAASVKLTKKNSSKNLNNNKKQRDNSNEKISKYFLDTSKKEEEEAAVKFQCPLCQMELSAEVSEQNRQLHVNQCLDKFSKQQQKTVPEARKPVAAAAVEKKTESEAAAAAVVVVDKKFADQIRDEGVPNCPICGKVLSTMNSHQSHLKKCASEFHIKPDSLVELVKKQRERILKDLENGFVPSDVHLPKAKTAVAAAKNTKRKQPSRLMKMEQPTNELDEELVTAIALSKSLTKDEDVDPKHLRVTKRGKNELNSKNSVEESEFMLCDDEDRRRNLEARLSELLANQVCFTDSYPEATLRKNKLVDTKFSSEKNYLWEKCKYFSQSNDSFYVDMFVKNANFRVGGKLFLNITQTENKFADVTFINTQTAFLLADLNNTTQLNITTQAVEDSSQTVVTPFGEILQSQLDEANQQQQQQELSTSKEQSTDIEVDAITERDFESPTKVNETDVEFWSSEKPVDVNQAQECVEKSCIELEETELEYSLTQAPSRVEPEKRVYIEDSFADEYEDEEPLQFDKTLVEEDKALNTTLTEEAAVVKMDDDDVILVNSDDDVEIIAEENGNHISETAFIVDDDSILLETSSSSSILPQIDFGGSKSFMSDSSFGKKYGKRKSVSVENLAVESDNKIMKLDDEVIVVDDRQREPVCSGLNNHLLLNETRNEDFNEDANYDEIWNNFNENQHEDCYSYGMDDNLVNATIFEEMESRSPISAPYTSSRSADNSICESFDHISMTKSPLKSTTVAINEPPKVFKTPKISQLVRESSIAGTDSPLTPMPNYVSMNTPSLKDQLKQYGVKPLPRRQAVRKLVEIYEYTHKEKLRRTKSCTDIAAASAPSQPPPPEKSLLKPKKSKLKKTVSNVEASTATTTKTTKTKKAKGNNELALFETDEIIALSQMPQTQTSEEDIRRRLHEYIVQSEDLYAKVLNYEPLDLENFYQEIKNLGEFRISTKLLMKLLDEFCITFTMKSIRSRISKFRSRKKH